MFLADLAKEIKLTLKPLDMANFAYDNVTSSQQLRDSRGKANKILNGTHMVVHQVDPYTTNEFNNERVVNTYNHKQVSLSPAGMRQHESIDFWSGEFGSTAFLTYE